MKQPGLLAVPLQIEDSKELELIEAIGHRRAPLEACGILIPTPHKGSKVIELPNRANKPNSFMVWGNDIREALGEWLTLASDEEFGKVTLWHTHPAGGVGPSRIDMRSRAKGLHHLVVTLTKDGPVPVFY